MPRNILLKNVKLPLSFQWKDTTVEILLEGEMIQSVQPKVVLGADREKETEIIDGRGRVVLPGLVDAHAHLVGTALSSLGVDLSPAKSTTEVLDLLREHARRSASAVICGHTFDPSALKEHRYLTLEELDSLEDVVQGRVVYVPRRDYHSCVVNRAGLERIPFPEGISGLEMQADGRTPSGLLKHDAATAAADYYNTQLTLEEKQQALRDVCGRAVSRGVTTIHVLEEPYRMSFLLPIRDQLPLDTVPYLTTWDVSIPRQQGFKQIGGCICLDGSFSSHTAALDEPFADAPEERGVLYFDDARVFDFVERAHRAGLQVAAHALAERAIEQLLSAYERALKKEPKEDHRHRIEHCELVREDHYRRIAEGGFYLSMQPTFEHLWGGPNGMYARYLGPERGLRTNAFRKWWDLGVVVAGGSDSNVTPLDSLLGIHSLVNNPNAEQRLTVQEAIQAYTENGAKIAFEEMVKGYVVPGFQADLIVLEEDPFEVPAERIKDIQVGLSFHRGRKVYEKPQQVR